VAYVLALAAALVAATTAVLQRLGVEDAPPEATMRLELMAYAVKRGIWLVGFGLMLVQFVLQATALRFGQLSTVQPVLTCELLFLVVLLAFVFHQPLRGRDWLGAVAIVAGLATFLLVARPKTGIGSPAGPAWIAVSLVTAVLVIALIVAAGHGPRWWRAAAFGASAAVLTAYNAALIKAVTTLITEGWGHVFVSWEPYALAVTGLGTVFLLQNALHAGPITASRATSVIVNPLASIVIGITVFQETLHTGPAAVAGELLALAVMCAGVIVLTRSPLIAGAGIPGGPGEFLGAVATIPGPPPGEVEPGPVHPG
jgi:drug/metabolite transporter (DMT)-like permease